MPECEHQIVGHSPIKNQAIGGEVYWLKFEPSNKQSTEWKELVGCLQNFAGCLHRSGVICYAPIQAVPPGRTSCQEIREIWCGRHPARQNIHRELDIPNSA